MKDFQMDFKDGDRMTNPWRVFKVTKECRAESLPHINI